MAYSVKRSLLFSAALVGLWLGLKLVLPLLMPFLLGTFLALAADPAAGFLKRRFRLPRALASALAVSALVACLGLLALLAAALAVCQISSLAHTVPAIVQKILFGVGLLESRLLSLGAGLPHGLQDGYQEAVTGLFSDGTALLSKISGAALGTAGTLIARLPGSAITLGTALISAYMICAKLPLLRRWIQAKIPPEKLQKLCRFWKRVTSTGKLWLYSQLKLMGVTFCILLCGFWLLRVSNGPFVALLVCLVDALPVLGIGTVLLPWALICFLSADTARALGLIGLYVSAALLRSVLEPKLVGSHLGLDPLVTLIAMYCGYKLWGLAGMLLLPLLAATTFQAFPEKKRDE